MKLDGQFLTTYPTHRDVVYKSATTWLNGKRVDDDVEGLWRIHNKIYDFTGFMNHHPGGRFWLECTRGTDITEAFESAHLNPSVEKILPKYFVREVRSPRNAPYTFKQNGFYKTLKRKAWPIISEKGSGPSYQMLAMQDSVAALFIITMILSSYYNSYLMAILAGTLLGMTMSMAHNFFHQADNFRMYYFDLSALSSKEWRVTHALSHHLFTNSLYDFEVSGLEPFAQFLPDPQKSVLYRIISPISLHFVIFIAFQIETVKRLIDFAVGRRRPVPENVLPYLELITMAVIAGSFGAALSLWLVMLSSSSYWFAYGSLIGTHHHPEMYHSHDTPRKDPDWGLCQLDSVRDRIETTGSLFIVTTTFGDHSLHHLFPTIDHSKLPYLYPVFLQTCEEFDIPFSFMRQGPLLKGFYQQLASATPNSSPPGHKGKKERILPTEYLQVGELKKL